MPSIIRRNFTVQSTHANAEMRRDFDLALSTRPAKRRRAGSAPAAITRGPVDVLPPAAHRLPRELVERIVQMPFQAALPTDNTPLADCMADFLELQEDNTDEAEMPFADWAAKARKVLDNDAKGRMRLDALEAARANLPVLRSGAAFKKLLDAVDAAKLSNLSCGHLRGLELGDDVDAFLLRLARHPVAAKTPGAADIIIAASTHLDDWHDEDEVSPINPKIFLAASRLPISDSGCFAPWFEEIMENQLFPSATIRTILYNLSKQASVVNNDYGLELLLICHSANIHDELDSYHKADEKTTINILTAISRFSEFNFEYLTDQVAELAASVRTPIGKAAADRAWRRALIDFKPTGPQQIDAQTLPADHAAESMFQQISANDMRDILYGSLIPLIDRFSPLSGDREGVIDRLHVAANQIPDQHARLHEALSKRVMEYRSLIKDNYFGSRQAFVKRRFEALLLKLFAKAPRPTPKVYNYLWKPIANYDSRDILVARDRWLYQEGRRLAALPGPAV